MPKRLKRVQSALWREGVGVPLGHDDDGLFGLACLFFRRGWVPAGVDCVVLGIDGADGRGEAEEVGFFQFAYGGLEF